MGLRRARDGIEEDARPQPGGAGGELERGWRAGKAPRGEGAAGQAELSSRRSRRGIGSASASRQRWLPPEPSGRAPAASGRLGNACCDRHGSESRLRLPVAPLLPRGGGGSRFCASPCRWQGCGLNTGTRETTATGKLCRTLQGNAAVLRLLGPSLQLLEIKPGTHLPER